MVILLLSFLKFLDPGNIRSCMNTNEKKLTIMIYVFSMLYELNLIIFWNVSCILVLFLLISVTWDCYISHCNHIISIWKAAILAASEKGLTSFGTWSGRELVLYQSFQKYLILNSILEHHNLYHGLCFVLISPPYLLK